MDVRSSEFPYSFAFLNRAPWSPESTFEAMQLDRSMVERVAALARLSFTEEEKERMVDELSKIVSFCQKLNEVNTDGVEPLIFVNEEECELRLDEAIIPLPKEEALKNAPQRDSDYYRVPKVIER